MERKQPGNKEILEMVDGSIDGIDQQRNRNLNRLQTIQDNRNSGLEREQARLMKKYGRQHPRINNLKSRLQYNQGSAREIKMEVVKASISVPAIDLNTWMVHGRVLEGKEGNPVQGVTVSLYTPDGNWVRELGYSCTDSQGYYSILHTIIDTGGETKKESSKETEVSVLEIKQDLYLKVSNEEKQVCHTESKPLRMEQGKIDYRLIILGKKDCSPPPEDDDIPPPTPNPEPPPENKRCWVVKGTVRYSDKTPASGVYVCFFDKDRIYEKALGRLETNGRGQFKVEYTEESMRDFFKNKPYLYIKVLDKQGVRLYQSRKPIQSVIKDEELNLVVKKIG